MMKTFALLFLVLSIINLPLYYLYNNSSLNNKLTLNVLWKYFTIGNIGNNTCGWSSIDLETLDHDMEDLEFECESG